jgi:hypothetical protein
MEIRSYRAVFDLERRIYRIDRLRLNPSGVPVRGVVYFLALLVATLLGARVPPFTIAAGVAPWYLMYVALPGASAALLSVIKIDGRPAHLALQSLVRFRLGPRRLAGMRRCARRARRWYPPEILFLPDGSDARMRRVRYIGPGAVLVTVAHECVESQSLGRGRLTLRERPRGGSAPGQVIALADGTPLRVR